MIDEDGIGSLDPARDNDSIKQVPLPGDDEGFLSKIGNSGDEAEISNELSLYLNRLLGNDFNLSGSHAEAEEADVGESKSNEKGGLFTSSIGIGGEVSNEVQEYLTELHLAKKNEILGERRALVRERFELETKIANLLAEKWAGLPEGAERPQSHLDDETFSETFSSAEHRQELADVAIENNSQIMKKTNEEVSWVGREPKTAAWSTISHRHDEIQGHKEWTQHDLNIAKQYFDSRKERNEIIAPLERQRQIDIVSKQIAGEIYSSVISDLLREVANELFALIFKVKEHASQVVMTGLFRSLGTVAQLTHTDTFALNTPAENSQNSIIIKATYQELKKECFNKLPLLATTQAFLHNPKNISFPDMFKTKVSWGDVSVEDSIFLNRSVDNIHDNSNIDHADLILEDSEKYNELYKFEQHYFEESKPTDGAKALKPSLILPDKVGALSVLKVFPRYHSATSLVVVGTSFGRLVIWSVPWDINKHKNCVVLAVTPALPRNEVSPVVDIQSASLNSDQIVSLMENGHIRVWSLAAKPKKRGFWTPWQSNSKWQGNSSFLPISPTCLFHLQAMDMNIPMQLVDEMSKSMAYISDLSKQLSQAEKMKQLTNPQASMLPASISFGQEFSLLGRHTSVFVGARGGDIIKFNIDYAVPDCDVPLPQGKPFVGLEYVHPINASNDEYLVSSIDRLKGNKIFRELCHFHKSKIILITSNGISSKEGQQMVTIDEKHYIAYWTLSKTNFSQNCWYNPVYTAKLEMGHIDYEDASVDISSVIGNTEPGESTPSTEVQNNLILRKRVLTSNTVVEVFYPIRVPSGLLEYSREVTRTQDDNQEINSEGCVWKKRFVVEIYKEPLVEQFQVSNDKSEIYFLATYKTKSSANKPSQISCSILTFDIAKKKFFNPTPKFNIGPLDKVHSISVSPIINDCYLKLVFVHVENTIRVFSLFTGAEIFNKNLDLFQPKLSNFHSNTFSICSSMKIAAFGAPDDKRIPLQFIGQVFDTSKHEKKDMNQIMYPVQLDTLKLKVTHFAAYEIKTENSTNSQSPNGANSEVVENFSFIAELLDSLLLGPLETLIVAIEVQKLQISSIYGQDLGVVQPSVWTTQNAMKSLLSYNLPLNPMAIVGNISVDEYLQLGHENLPGNIADIPKAISKKDESLVSSQSHVSSEPDIPPSESSHGLHSMQPSGGSIISGSLAKFPVMNYSVESLQNNDSQSIFAGSESITQVNKSEGESLDKSLDVDHQGSTHNLADLKLDDVLAGLGSETVLSRAATAKSEVSAIEVSGNAAQEEVKKATEESNLIGEVQTLHTST